LSVGAKHLEDKLSVIAKNSSPNASPVQLSVVSCQLFIFEYFEQIFGDYSTYAHRIDRLMRLLLFFGKFYDTSRVFRKVGNSRDRPRKTDSFCRILGYNCLGSCHSPKMEKSFL